MRLHALHSLLAWWCILAILELYTEQNMLVTWLVMSAVDQWKGVLICGLVSSLICLEELQVNLA